MLSRSIFFKQAVKPILNKRLQSNAAFALCNQELMSKPLKEIDPELNNFLNLEKKRQRESLTLIASENFTSSVVFSLLGSEFQNKYSENRPNKRYYGGNEFIDQVELLCEARALKAFNLNPEEWGVNVQPLAGSTANLIAFSSVLEVGERLMGLDLPSGGHLTHGYQLPNGKKISGVSKYFTTMPYQLDPKTGLIDYETLSKTSQLFRPKVLVAGASAYARLIDYKKMREIANKVSKDCYLVTDMAHISGLVAAGTLPSPFEYSDIVTTTTHKSLRGPRGAMIFYRKGTRYTTKKGEAVKYDLEDRVNFSTFPQHQGGPFNHTIAALAAALQQTMTPAYKKYQEDVVANAAYLAEQLKQRGFELVSGGTDNHLVLIDLNNFEIDGARVEALLEKINISTNKNTVPTDKSALYPMGLRIGTPAMTTRNFGKEEFAKVAEYLEKGVLLSKKFKKIQDESPVKVKGHTAKLNEFKKLVAESDEVKQLAEEVKQFVTQFPMPGDL
ncbi:glycine hydroxymethyltransferase shm1 [Hanseniaspora valbyensis]